MRMMVGSRMRCGGRGSDTLSRKVGTALFCCQAWQTPVGRKRFRYWFHRYRLTDSRTQCCSPRPEDSRPKTPNCAKRSPSFQSSQSQHLFSCVIYPDPLSGFMTPYRCSVRLKNSSVTSISHSKAARGFAACRGPTKTFKFEVGVTVNEAEVERKSGAVGKAVSLAGWGDEVVAGWWEVRGSSVVLVCLRMFAHCGV